MLDLLQYSVLRSLRSEYEMVGSLDQRSGQLVPPQESVQRQESLSVQFLNEFLSHETATSVILKRRFLYKVLL